MALDFPTSPSPNQVYTAGAKSWSWDNTSGAWLAVNAGIQGTQGTQGALGTQGAQGLQGITGANGSNGSQGTQGIQGIQGTQGAQGLQGITGSQGTQGTQGIQGIQGTAGFVGSNGAQGTQGQQGIQGIQGITGSQGITGAQGITGTNGTQGAQGTVGSTGAQGITGTQGAVGSQGSTGSQGTIGTSVTGAQGTTGASILGTANTFTSTNAFSNSVFVNSSADITTLAGILTLYSTGNATTSQIMFKNTTGLGYGNHGAITGGYNTYFVMDTTDRGWIFRNATTAANVASISNTGVITATTFSGALSGNAATATTADNIDGIAFKNAYSGSSFVVDTTATNGIGYSSGYSLFGQSDGGVYCSTYNSDWQHQINGDFRTGQIAVRGKNSNTWQAWRTVLDSSNYTSYAPTLTGGSASGTWGINVTGSSASCSGNAATATTATNHYGAGASYIASSTSGTAYSAAIQVREAALAGAQAGAIAYAPRLGFHWSGLVASSIVMEANGRIAIVNNPGTSYEAFACGALTASGAITSTGNITAYYSDDRLKTRLGPIDNALNKVLSLNGFYFEANETAQALGYTKKKEVGVSAQEVELVLPEIIAPAPIDAQYKTLDYGKLVPLLIEAIKDLNAKVDSLQTQLNNK